MVLLIVYLVGYLIALLLILRLWQLAKASDRELWYVVLIALGSWISFVVCIGIGVESARKYNVPFEDVLRQLWTKEGG